MAERLREYIKTRLSDEQRDVCTLDGSFVVRACPGSGKTRTVGTRLAWRTSKWRSRRAGLAALSFTNVACEEIGRHLRELRLPERPGWPHFLGTIDSFVNQFIFLPFGHLAMGCTRRPQIVHPDDNLHSWVRERLRKARLAGCYRRGCDATSFEFQADGGLIYVGKRSQPGCERDRCADVKSVMTVAGFALPADAMYWGMKVLEESRIARALAVRFPEIIVDEAQDTSETQVEIIRRLSRAGCGITLVGDPDQSIFAFNGARPDLFTAFEDEWPTVRLTRNFRSSQAICDATYRFSQTLKRPATAAGKASDYGVKPFVIRYADGREGDLLSGFRQLLAEHSIAASGAAALAWRHDLISRVSGARRVAWPPRVGPMARALARAATYRDREGARIGDAHEDVMWALLRICFGTGEREGEWSAVEPVGLREWRRWTWKLLERLPSSDTPLREWGPTLRPIVEAFLAETGWPRKVRLSGVLQRCGHGSAGQPVCAFVRTTSRPGGITCKVIHGAKGETYEAVMVVCGAGTLRRECDIRQWLRPKDPDAQRTGYVAMTRARKLLVLALPENTRSVPELI